MPESERANPPEPVHQASRLRSLMAIHGGVAHDLKSPLNAMVLNLELLKRSVLGDDVEPEVREKRQRWLRVMEQEIARLRQALDLLLVQVAPGESSGPRTVDLVDVLRDLERLLAPQSRQQKVALEVVADGPLPVHGHRDQLAHAVLGLAVNAFEAVDGGGRIELAARRDGEAAVVEVRDDGPGLPEEGSDRIFEAGFTTRGRPEGLGLPVARTIAERHGGTLRVSSRDAGAAFELRLPLAE